MTAKKGKNNEQVITPADSKKEKSGRKRVSVTASESNMTADMKNMQHGGEQPAR